jgi:formylglycine-generating enzyme required for sulfatase activity
MQLRWRENMSLRYAVRVVFAGMLSLLLPVLALAENPGPIVQNDLGMTFVRIEPGSFVMGSPKDEPYRDDRETQHRVTLTKAYYMQTTEVTAGQWRQIMGKGILGTFLRGRGPANLPITRVCWHDVESFLIKINKRYDGVYRLPTEAEWEYAARAGTTSMYNWGDRIDCRNAMFANNRRKYDNCRTYNLAHRLPADGPAPVKSYPPNGWGLYDMHGNVWEWCHDWFGPYPAKAVTDPQGPVKGTQRVRRGGSWFGSAHACRSANRAYGHPASRLQTTGFRLVWTAKP